MLFLLLLLLMPTVCAVVCWLQLCICLSVCDDDDAAGDNGDDQVKEKGYAVVVVAEGAGEELLGKTGETDATG